MESLKFSQNPRESQEDVLRRLHAREEQGLVAHVCVLLVAVDDAWLPTCARIDVAKREENVFRKSRPSGRARLLTEVVELPELIARLKEAFAKGPFLVAGERIAGHGMDASWAGMHYTDYWHKFGTPGPVFHLYPNNHVQSLGFLTEVIESDDGQEAYDGLRDCTRATMRFRGSHGDDARAIRFQIVEWDYRGVLKLRMEGPRKAILEVSPAADPDLKLAYVAYDGERKISRIVSAPSEVIVDTLLPLSRISAALRHRDTLICQDGIDLWDAQPTGSGSDVSPPASLTTQLLLEFMQDTALADVVSSDLVDFDAAVRGGVKKGALVLGGSILEAVLTDVLRRNRSIASSYCRNKQKDLDKAGLAELVDIAARIIVKLPDSTMMPLLKPLTASMGKVIIEHRDLIHPDAQVRVNARIDANAVRVIHGLLGAVLQDLRDAHSKGALEEWSKGNTVP